MSSDFSLKKIKIELFSSGLKRRQFPNTATITMQATTNYKQEIKMSAATKQLIDSDPKLAEDIKGILEALESEHRAEFEEKKRQFPNATMQAAMNFAKQKIEEKNEMKSKQEEKNKMDNEKSERMGMFDAVMVELLKHDYYKEKLYRMDLLTKSCKSGLMTKFEEVLEQLMYLHSDDSDDENVCECGVPESEECRPDCPYQARKAAEEDCPLERECLKKIKEIQRWVSGMLGSKHEAVAYRPFGRNLVNMQCGDSDFAGKYVKRVICTFVAWLISEKHEAHKQAKTASKLTKSGGKWIADHIRVCTCGCNETYPARFYVNVPFMLEEEKNDSKWCGFTIEYNIDQTDPKEAWFTITTKCMREIMDVGEEEGKSLEEQNSLIDDIFGPKLDWLARKPNLCAHIDVINKGRIETAHERLKRKQKHAAKELKEAARREEQAERRRVDKEVQDRRAAERKVHEEEERKVREIDFAARVAAVAEREKQNKEAEKAAKEEKARIAEEKARIKKEQAEAERKAKFVNKKK